MIPPSKLIIYRQLQNTTHNMSMASINMETPDKTKTKTKTHNRKLTNQEFNTLLRAGA